MGDIYDKIRDKINNQAEVQATEQDWKSFQQFRNAKDSDKSNKSALPLWIMGFLLLLLGLSNAYWMVNENRSSLSNDNVVSIIDTVYITKYIDNSKTSPELFEQTTSQLDIVTSELSTIKTQHAYLRSKLANQTNLVSQLQASKDRLETQYVALENQNKYSNPLTKIANSDHYYKNRTNEDPRHLSIENTFENRHSLSLSDQLPRLNMNEIIYQKSRIIDKSKIIYIKNDKPFNLIDAITPKSFSLNGNIGYLYNPIGNYNKGFGGDIRATTLFAKSLRGYLGFTFYNTQAKLDISAPNIIYPTLPEGDHVEYVTAQNKNYAINTGLEYLINLDNRWRPYFGLGFGRVLSNTLKHQFEISSATGNEYYRSSEYSDPQENYNQMIFTLGTDFNISKNIDIRLGLNYTHSFRYKSNSHIFLIGGAYYHF